MTIKLIPRKRINDDGSAILLCYSIWYRKTDKENIKLAVCNTLEEATEIIINLLLEED